MSMKYALRLVGLPSLALALETYQVWLLNNGIFPVTSGTFPLAREFQTLVGIVVGLAVLLSALRHPDFIKVRVVPPIAFACAAVGAGLLLCVPGSPTAVTMGLMLLSLAGTANHYLIGIAFAHADSPQRTSIGVACAVLVATLVTTVSPAPSFCASVVIDAVITLSVLLLLWREVTPVWRESIKGKALEQLALASPRSFLSLGHQLYILMFIFSAAFGFALSLRISQFTPVSSYLSLCVLLAAVAWFVLAPDGKGGHDDALFAVAALLVVAGFLLAPLNVAPSAANGLLYAGNSCFKVLSWTVMAALCARNMAGSLAVLACGAIVGSAGTFLGADLGHLCNALLATHPDGASLVTSVVVLALFAYVIFGLRGFTFADTIQGVEPVEELPVPVDMPPDRDALIESSCDALAGECGLTEREREVFGMLVRGHNGYHIRDELTLSYNTVKTHVKRIYRKLDVHSQQELIDLVESRCNV